MQLAAVLCMLVAVASAQQFSPQFAPPPQQFAQAQAVNSATNRDLQKLPPASRSEIRDDSGQFSESIQTYDGQSFVEQGVLHRTADGLDNVLVKQGSYQYTSPEGQFIKLDYTADENGFQPVGAHLPVAPVVPETTF